MASPMNVVEKLRKVLIWSILDEAHEASMCINFRWLHRACGSAPSLCQASALVHPLLNTTPVILRQKPTSARAFSHL